MTGLTHTAPHSSHMTPHRKCHTCGYHTIPQYQTPRLAKTFCSLSCIKTYFHTRIDINYEIFRIKC